MSKSKGYFTCWREYKKELIIKEVSKDYLRRIELTLKKIYHWLKEDGRTTRPMQITYDDVLYIRNKIPISEQPNRSTRNQRNQIETFRWFLKFCGNYVRQPPFRPYNPHRPNISSKQYDTIVMTLQDINDDWDIITGRIMILLGSLTIRRVGQLRLRPEDIQEDRINVIDKGRYGGKPRVVPIDPVTYSILKNYIILRENIIKYCLEKRPNQKIPDKLLIWYTYQNKVGSVHRSKYDRLMKRISEITGVKISSHRLRRYGSTEFYSITLDPETTMKLGGWSDMRTFQDYLGLDPILAKGVKKMMNIRYSRIKEKVGTNLNNEYSSTETTSSTSTDTYKKKVL